MAPGAVCAGPLHTEAVVLLVGHDSSRSQTSPSPQALPSQSVTAKSPSPPPEVGSPGGLSIKQRFGLALCRVSAPRVCRKAHPRFLGLVAGKEELFFGKLTAIAASIFSSSSTNV